MKKVTRRKEMDNILKSMEVASTELNLATSKVPHLGDLGGFL
jgi:hypothetical protein